MGRSTTIGLITVIVILALVASVQLGKARSAEAREAEALRLAQDTASLLDALGFRCSARPSDLVKLDACVTSALARDDFETVEYRNYNERRNETGVLIVKNVGARTYDGRKFSLRKNGETVTTGCHITGTILPEYTCRFTLDEPCDRGDVLEISYGDGNDRIRLVMTTC